MRRKRRRSRFDDAVCAVAFAIAVKRVDQVGKGFECLAGDAFKGARADMRGNDNLGMVEQRMVGRWWFLVEDVGSVTGEFSGIEGCEDCCLVDQFAAAGIDDPSSVG